MEPAGALEVAGPTAPPTLAPDPGRAPYITADRYFAAVRQLGSPADTPAEVHARPEPQREAADGVLIAGLQEARSLVGDHPLEHTFNDVRLAPSALDDKFLLSVLVNGRSVVIFNGTAGQQLRKILFAPLEERRLGRPF